MLDSGARRRLDPLLDGLAGLLAGWGLRANQVTVLALVLGVLAGALVYAGLAWGAVALLWCSGLLDAVDGALARRRGRASPWGALLDITGDRCVEGSVLLGLALRQPAAALPLLALAVAIILSLTVFLTTGALVRRGAAAKSFYYQAGLMERSEGFLAFTAMILLPAYVAPLAWLAAALVAFTAGQRLREAYRLLGGPGAG